MSMAAKKAIEKKAWCTVDDCADVGALLTEAGKRASVTDAIIQHEASPMMATVYKQEIQSIENGSDLWWRGQASTGHNKGIRKRARVGDQQADEVMDSAWRLPETFVNPVSHKESLFVLSSETNECIEKRLQAGAVLAEITKEECNDGSRKILELFSYEMSSPITVSKQLPACSNDSLMDSMAVNRFIICRDLSIRSYLIKMMIGRAIPLSQSEPAAAASGIMLFNRLFSKNNISFFADTFAVIRNIDRASIFQQGETAAVVKYMCWHICKFRESHSRLNIETIPFAAAIMTRTIIDYLYKDGRSNSIDYMHVANDINKSMRARHIPPFVESRFTKDNSAVAGRIKDDKKEAIRCVNL